MGHHRDRHRLLALLRRAHLRDRHVCAREEWQTYLLRARGKDGLCQGRRCGDGMIATVTNLIADGADADGWRYHMGPPAAGPLMK